jgi:hypothetical protein
LQTPLSSDATLPVNGLESGVYYYSIEEKGKTSITGKLLIQK